MKKILSIGLFLLLHGSTTVNAGVLDDILKGGNSNDLLGFINGLNRGIQFQIPGAGAITLSCSNPTLSIPSMDICGIEQSILDSLTSNFQLPTLDLGDNSCGFSVNLSDSACNKLRIQDLCKSGNSSANKLLELKRLRSGIGGFDGLTGKSMATLGNKSIFGKDVCPGGPERTAPLTTPAMQKVYGSQSDSYINKVLSDKEIGGNPSNLNTRKASAFLRCAEIAEKENITIEECSMSNINMPDEFNATTVETTINNTAAETAKPVTGPTGKLSQNASSFWPLFVKQAQANGINDPKMLLAVAMQESGKKLNVNAIGPNKDKQGNIKSTDWGMMQINDKAHGSVVNRRYAQFGGMPQALMPKSSGMGAVERSIEYGADVLKKCANKFSQNSWLYVDCYNKGAGNAGKLGEAYINGVKKNYATISGEEASLSLSGGGLYETQASSIQSVAVFENMAKIATERRRTLTHMGQDFADSLPLEHRKRYEEIVNRYMAQQTFIEGSNKKASDIANAIIQTFSYQSSIQSTAASGENNTTNSGNGLMDLLGGLLQ